jgi:hypothetical protein
MQKLRWLEAIAVSLLAVVAVWIACNARNEAREALRLTESSMEQMIVELNRAKKAYDVARAMLELREHIDAMPNVDE